MLVILAVSDTMSLFGDMIAGFALHEWTGLVLRINGFRFGDQSRVDQLEGHLRWHGHWHPRLHLHRHLALRVPLPDLLWSFLPGSGGIYLALEARVPHASSVTIRDPQVPGNHIPINLVQTQCQLFQPLQSVDPESHTSFKSICLMIA